jgi:glycosyltransferase involved in cell wall biosynthesis
MRILADYRPALRERTGVGEYLHGLIRAYSHAYAGEMTIFTSSWRDRPSSTVAELRADVVDRRIPVSVLNLLWHRVEWPPIETLAGEFDVAHSAHPLLMPSRRAAQVVTIHDLFFLTHPEQTRAEIRRDYPALARAHARRAAAVVTSTQHGKCLVSEHLEVAPDRIYVCPPGRPTWQTLGRAAHVPANGYILFLGTLEPRKNVGALLDAYELLLQRRARVPDIVLAGRSTAAADGWLRRIAHPPLAGRVRHLGYVPDDEREGVFAGARVVVMPSLDEGFGLPALEAMSAGIPVVASNRGSLPEVVAAGGILVDPLDRSALADALATLVADDAAAAAWGSAGLARAREFSWTTAASTLRQAYTDAVMRHRT